MNPIATAYNLLTAGEETEKLLTSLYNESAEKKRAFDLGVKSQQQGLPYSNTNCSEWCNGYLFSLSGV